MPDLDKPLVWFGRYLRWFPICVAGTAVTVRPRFAEQLLIHNQVVHCKGRLADAPLRRGRPRG